MADGSKKLSDEGVVRSGEAGGTGTFARRYGAKRKPTARIPGLGSGPGGNSGYDGSRGTLGGLSETPKPRDLVTNRDGVSRLEQAFTFKDMKSSLMEVANPLLAVIENLKRWGQIRKDLPTKVDVDEKQAQHSACICINSG